MEYPSQAAKELAARLNDVEIGCEDNLITDEDKVQGLVVVYGGSDDLMEFRGAIYGEVGCYNGGTAYIKDGQVLDFGDFDCECEWAEKAKKDAIARSRTIDALWGEIDYSSWAYRTDIPHVGFDVIEDGETYCRGIVFDIGALEKAKPEIYKHGFDEQNIGMTGEDMATCIDELRAELAAKDEEIRALDTIRYCLETIVEKIPNRTFGSLDAARAKLAEIREGKS